ncbi:unnamed protein product [Schistocephalus solidus]|uniref:Uncharacterized protein n=1 Tax=Schistocephalus solidus TaxID=70667 RepID=A0A183SLF8_SCHSO|nr:unnamed protein product [Schistocephalus solidus]
MMNSAGRPPLEYSWISRPIMYPCLICCHPSGQVVVPRQVQRRYRGDGGRGGSARGQEKGDMFRALILVAAVTTPAFIVIFVIILQLLVNDPNRGNYEAPGQWPVMDATTIVAAHQRNPIASIIISESIEPTRKLNRACGKLKVD